MAWLSGKMIKSKRFWGLGLLAVTLVGLVSAEIYARFGLGLGDPPLMRADDRVEYLMQPGAYQRFGNQVRVNDYSMRSDAVTPSKTDPDELRVLVLGDSVINGGAHTDHGELATTLIQTRLAERLDRSVWVGNVSEVSWGPGNLLAYTQDLGWFDADAVVVVLSSHDAGDAMNFKPLVGVSLSYPTDRPWLAVQELAVRYLPSVVSAWTSGEPDVTATPARPLGFDLSRNDPRVEKALKRFGDLLSDATAADRPTLYVHHPEATQEIGGDWLPGRAWMLEVASRAGVNVIEMQPTLRAAIDAGAQPYRDKIHLNAAGQRLLADQITPWLAERLGEAE